MPVPRVFEAYPEIVKAVGLPKINDYLETIHRRNAMSPGEYAEMAQSSIVTRELVGRAFRMMVDRPEDGNPEHVVVVGGEFGNGIMTPTGDYNGAWLRALAIRDAVAPAATVVYAPNNTMREDNMNLSRQELQRTYGGSSSPFVDRLKMVVGDNAKTVMGVGLSQGAVIVGDYMAELGNAVCGYVAFEAPNVQDRSVTRLAADFKNSGKNLPENIAFNSPDDEPTQLTMQHLDSIRLWPTLEFSAGILRPANVAVSGLLRRATLEGQINRLLEAQVGVVHVWADGDAVSPAEANARIAESHDGRTLRYRKIELSGKTADHSSTNVHLLSAAALGLAADLSRRTRA